MNSNRIGLLVGLAGLIATARAFNAPLRAAETAALMGTFTKLPIKELTVFKDGHACVAHEGVMPTDAQGNVIMDYLPTPLVGAFWPYAAESTAHLTSVTAGQKRVLVERTALDLRSLLEANVGAEAVINEAGLSPYHATILSLPARSAEELSAASPPNTPERLPEKGALVLLKTAEGAKAVGLDRIQDVTFKGAHRATVTNEEFRNLLTLRLAWASSQPGRAAKVGLFYVQKGVRWIPQYKLEIDGRSNAVVRLQATLINELADLDDVSVNLVVGVPTFAFKDTIDPMALQQNLAQLSQFFQSNPDLANGQVQNFSNAILSQQARFDGPAGLRGAGSGGGLGPEIAEAGSSEDLFVYTVPHVTLKKGERVVLAVAEFTLSYQDVYTLELPFGPPPEVRSHIGSEQQRELARLFNAPKVMHKLRLTNRSQYPLTTAPALLVRSGRVLAQGLMTYTAAGATVDLPVTTAVAFAVKKSETETKRAPDALRQNNSSWARIDLHGQITLTSHHAQAATLEVTRYVLGTADHADHEGKVDKINAFEDSGYLGAGDYPYWWGWYGWPAWWHHINGVGRLSWNFTLPPKETIELAYDWHYFWQ